VVIGEQWRRVLDIIRVCLVVDSRDISLVHVADSAVVAVDEVLRDDPGAIRRGAIG